MATSESEAKYTLFLSIVSHFSLFPLLFKPNLALIKISLLLTYILIQCNGIRHLWPSMHRKHMLPLHELIYDLGLIALLFYEFILQYALNLDKRFPFLPLMLTSVYCSIGIMYFWLKYYAEFLFNDYSNRSIKKWNACNLVWWYSYAKILFYYCMWICKPAFQVMYFSNKNHMKLKHWLNFNLNQGE